MIQDLVNDPTAQRIANTVFLILVTMGMLINGFFVWVAIKRRIDIKRSGEQYYDAVARLTMARAVRQEVCFLLCQVCMMIISFWAFKNVLPIEPPEARTFYFASLTTRIIVSILLVYCSFKDFIDRGKIRVELDKLHPNTPPSKVG